MIRAVIVDDESMARISLRTMIDDICPNVDVVGEASSVQDGIEVIELKRPDLVFLDVQMPKGSGFDLLAHYQDPQFKIIFVTSYDHYAIRAFKVAATDYILKPIDESDLMCAVARVQKLENETSKGKIIQNENLATLLGNIKVQDPQNIKICLPTFEGMSFIRVGDIIQIKSDGAYSRFYLKDNSNTLICRNLGEIEELIPIDYFIRVHRSHMVASNFVKSINKTKIPSITLEDGTEIMISRRKKNEVIEKIIKT
ncbi:MAG: response regulator transcription factor [Bacteroidia bacterium]|nr:response regulator transcription factor [Bacteroidia bacterium]